MWRIIKDNKDLDLPALKVYWKLCKHKLSSFNMWMYYTILFIRWWLLLFDVKRLPRRSSNVLPLMRCFLKYCYIFFFFLLWKLLSEFWNLTFGSTKLISCSVGYHWRKLFNMAQYQVSEKSSVLSWEHIFQSKCTSRWQTYKVFNVSLSKTNF